MKQVVFDTIGSIFQGLQQVPFSIVDQIINEVRKDPDQCRETILKLMSERYAEELKRSVGEAEEKLKKELK